LKSWKITTIAGYAGFYLIQNSLHGLTKWFWILRSLVDFTQYPIKSNLTSEAALSSHRFPWKHYDPNNWKRKSANERKQPIERLRWTTLGYQYNWETKKYYAGHYVEFPSDLANLCGFYVDAIGLDPDRQYNPQTAIVNFYPEGSTLGIHCDNLEWDSTSPLVSVSLAHSAVFLLGDADRTQEPISLLLNSGDVVIMTETCRQRYHAVPKIFITDGMNKNDFEIAKKEFTSLTGEEENAILHGLEKYNENDVQKAIEYIKTRRINLNVRQLKKLEDPMPLNSNDVDPRLNSVDGQTI